ncbi:MAG: hypothetical protein SVR08_16120, partial [Spirochaetota bacterium]|nr:hypothetical protein [Spirochaetota bacterium]
RDYKKKTDPVYGNSWRYFKLWPVFEYEYDDRGNLSFNLLSLLPFRDPEGYEKLYQPFWTIIEYSRLESGEKRLGLLLRIYYQRWGDDFMYIKIPFIFSYGSSDEILVELSFLFSMFAYCNDSEGKYLRLFWIPLKIGEGTASKIAKRETVNELSNKVYWEELTRLRHANLRVKNEFILYSMNIF